MIKIGRITLAITVIAIGTVWLLSIWNPPLANMLSMYWPVVFIIYGLEVIIASFWKQQKKLSIWLLIVSVVLAFTAGSFLENKSFNWQFVWNLDGIFENGITEQVDVRQLSLQADSIAIEVTNGRVEVFPSDDDAMRFVGTAIWQQKTDKPEVAFIRQGDSWKVKNDNLISLQGKLYIPQEINHLNFVSTNGALQIQENLQELQVHAETTNGVVELKSGEIGSISTVNGAVRLGAVEKVTATTVNGDIEMIADKIQTADISTQQGKVTVIGTDIGIATIRTVNGSIDLRIPIGSTQIKAQTVNGKIEIFGEQYEKNIVIEPTKEQNQALLEMVNGSITVKENKE